uniref:Sucrose phosphatase-like domain-containing protein n=1 Tax=Chlamydomonas leiostraca TaxID=1034604 RepID=A0A7S0QZA9_9CHLO|mmetsp:Transcript_10447/g.25947  ORF Transcript_10447/g.25947 Transcript_10447/m.25947 type:complete len:409 (+) Transcript_10447:71-1297(+)
MQALQQHAQLHACTARRPRLILASAAVEASPQVSTIKQGERLLRVYHKTSWNQSFVHGSLCGSKWQDFKMERVPSAPGKWMRADIPLPSGAATTPLLEFVLTNRQEAWDKPGNGGNYVVDSTGSWVVRNGGIQRATGKAVMVVSDLDGTMVGDDSATGTFRGWWEEEAVPRGGVLVYNTGRSLESFLKLLLDKKHCLALPDALISAVGTKVYTQDGSGKWAEDMGWSKTLDADWKLEGAREACYRALAEVGKERMHFRPPEEQNAHKVTCGVRADVMGPVQAVVEANLASAGVKANVIVSGHGDWRYMDIVPLRAGKLEALHHVRKMYGFPVEAAVACGDSGNDILMLQGENPAIVVGNAQPDLRKWYDERARAEPQGTGPGGKQRLYLAPKHEALGILEGLAHWGFK